MFNKIILVGNLTRDVEVKYSASNLAIGNTSIATNKKFKNQMGEEKEEVMFVEITFFGRTAEVANQYLKKGSKILVDGRLKLDQWTDTNGQKRSKHSVTVESMKMLGNKGDSEHTYSQNDAYQGNNQSYGKSDYIQPTSQNYTPEKSEPKKDFELSITEEDMPF